MRAEAQANGHNHSQAFAGRSALRSLERIETVRPPPHNLEAEQALLGAILVNNEALDRVSGFLSPDHFFDPLHARIFETLSSLIHAGKTATPITVKTFFENVEPINDHMTVPQYLGRLAANATTIINAAEYGRTICELSTRRAIIVLGEDLANDALSSETPAAALLEELECHVAKLRTDDSAAELLATISAASFDGKLAPPRKWHAKGWIPAGDVTLLSGDGGTGKSLLALQLAASTAAERPWMGLDVMRGSSLLVSAEDDLDELHRRTLAVATDLDISLERLANLHLLSLAGKEAILATFDKANVMTKTAIWRTIIKLIENLRPRLVVLDTLADLFGGDEINRSQTRQFVQLLRGAALNFDTTILLLAHPSVAGMKSGTGTSGSTAWSNSVRSRLYFDRVREDGETELDPDARILTTKKANYGPVGQSIPLRWCRGAFKTTAADTDISEAVIASNVRAENAFLELLTLYAEQRRDVSATPSSSYAPARFAKEDIGKRVGKDALAGAMTRLLSSGRIRVEEHGPESKRRKRLVIA